MVVVAMAEEMVAGMTVEDTVVVEVAAVVRQLAELGRVHDMRLDLLPPVKELNPTPLKMPPHWGFAPLTDLVGYHCIGLPHCGLGGAAIRGADGKGARGGRRCQVSALQLAPTVPATS